MIPESAVTLRTDFNYEGFFHERVAFHVHEMGLKKPQAEQLAYYESLVVFVNKAYPTILAQFESTIFLPTVN